MEKNMRTFLSEFYGKDNSRRARVISTWGGLEVEFYENDEKKESRMLTEHNLQYAEDACENWVEGIIE
jgi:hypothetical protein